VNDDVLLLPRGRKEFIAVLTRGPYWNLSSRNTPKSHIMLNILFIIVQTTPGHSNLDYGYAESSFDPWFSSVTQSQYRAYIIML
jgi:hypothetical protein